ncbi:MAG TPA: rhodanese-like domain-containing protein [Solirubrobacteraceae bacterium]|nr:rhodanese-like domain-containing protein [Solirubrobacteraceae bacterium]
MTVDQLLDVARARLDRLEPVAAYQAALSGARMVDIRSESQLTRDGMIPGALIIPRNVVEWRLDPRGAYRNPHAPAPSDWTIVVCDEGYQSSLVAATLKEMGFEFATDLVGGFRAWRAMDLPVAPCEEEHLAAVAEMEACIRGADLRV